MDALAKLQVPQTRVVRDGQVAAIAATEARCSAGAGARDPPLAFEHEAAVAPARAVTHPR